MALGAIHSGWAEASLFIFIGSVVFIIFSCICLKCCYYPGGRKRSAVMDVGVLPLYNVSYQQQQKEAEEEREWAAAEAQSEEQTPTPGSRDEDMYYEPPTAEQHVQPARPPPITTRDDLYSEELPVRRNVQMMQI